jgi:stage II sporulation protein R
MKVLKFIFISIILIAIVNFGIILGPICNGMTVKNVVAYDSGQEAKLAQTPDQLIRFHVIANSDSQQDQALKRAVRDAILEEISPRLAVSHSLDESRAIIKKIRPEIENIGKSVIKDWDKDYTVHTEYGYFGFPTKSYGSLVLPAGHYEALRVVLGKGEGSNWWCVLFPPLCFVDIEHSTAVQVDGKPGIPINKELVNTEQRKNNNYPKVRFYFWEILNKWLSNKI